MNTILLKILLLSILLSSSVISQSADKNKKDIVRMGALADMVIGVDLKEADAAFKIWTDTFIKRLHAKNVYDFTFEYKMYEDVNSLKKDLKNNHIDYFNVSTESYFDLNPDGEFVPFLSGTNNLKDNFMYYFLVTSVNNKTDDPKQFINKKILVSKSNLNSMGNIWLKSFLRENLSEKLYNSVSFNTSNQNENEDLLAVFFGRADYALISSGAYDLACELNPSIKNKIRILKKSGALLNGIFVYRKGMNPSTLKVIRDITTDFHNDNEGRQILNLFKISKIVTISDADLIESINLLNKYHKYFK